MGSGSESLFAASGSHDQDGRHDNIWKKTLQKSSPEPAGRILPIIVCSNDDPGVALAYFTARSNLVM